MPILDFLMSDDQLKKYWPAAPAIADSTITDPRCQTTIPNLKMPANSVVLSGK